MVKLLGRTSLRINVPKIVDQIGTLKFTKLIKIAPSVLIKETTIIVAMPVGKTPRYKVAIMD